MDQTGYHRAARLAALPHVELSGLLSISGLDGALRLELSA
jgi:hypothetical protein